jgi:ABC-type molybdate transport system ATPase subunit
MDSSFNEALENLHKYKETHPNIVNLWIEYINRRKENMLRVIKECNEVSNKLKNKNDLSINNIASLYILQSTLHSNIT